MVGNVLAKTLLDAITTSPEEAAAEEAAEVKLASERIEEKERIDAETSADASRDYRYPLDLDASFPVRIIFQVYKVDGLQILDGVKEKIQEFFSFGDDESESAEQKRKNESVAESSVTGQESKSTKNAATSTKPELQSYDNSEGGDPFGKITLPLMTPLRYSDVADYNSNVDLGMIGGSVESLLGGGSPLSGITQADGRLTNAATAVATQAVTRNIAAIGGGIGGFVTSKLLGKKSGSGGGLFGGLGAQVLAGGAADKAANAIASATRITGKANLRTLFKGVQMRPFTFDFKMVAYSPEEAEQIKQIVKMFREELYPESIDFNNIPVAYKFPNLFQIQVKNRRNTDLGFKFQRCYLQNVETTFNESVQGIYDDGQFIEVSISLKFIEIVTLDKKKVRDQGF